MILVSFCENHPRYPWLKWIGGLALCRLAALCETGLEGSNKETQSGSRRGAKRTM